MDTVSDHQFALVQPCLSLMFKYQHCPAPEVDTLKSTYSDARGKLDVVEMRGIVLDAEKWSEILQGVDAVIHIACPVWHPWITSENIYIAANEGTQKLLDAVAQSSVKRFILTSSIGTFFKPDFSSIMDKIAYAHNTWSEIEDFDPKEHVPSHAYIASKIISERLVWRAAEKGPHIDFTTILPSTVYGWRLKDYPVPQNVLEFNANYFLYTLIQKERQLPDLSPRGRRPQSRRCKSPCPRSHCARPAKGQEEKIYHFKDGLGGRHPIPQRAGYYCEVSSSRP